MKKLEGEKKKVESDYNATNSRIQVDHDADADDVTNDDDDKDAGNNDDDNDNNDEDDDTNDDNNDNDKYAADGYNILRWT